MAIFSHPEQHQVMPVNGFAVLGGEKRETVLILLGGQRRVPFSSHPQNGSLRHFEGIKEDLARHPEIAFLVVRRNTTFVAKGEANLIPRQIAGDPAKLRVNRPWSVTARKR